MSSLEILAPVGDEKNFYCAIANGADAVYLGLKNFNARDKAQNFTTENLREYVKYAHIRGVKVYVTVNTILVDSEIEKLIEMVDFATQAKVDAFIVQDLGVATVLKKTFKNIVLHASTQMGIHSLEGAQIAEKLGFSRIVLSRETSLEDIREIKQKTNLEIEYFVHGALCVCFSGNCYFSSLSFNESGNRGRCLQPCRLPFIAKDGNEQVNKGYLLSATDLCFIRRLKQLKELGICSLKIEGRLRRPAYVSYVTQTYSLAKKLLEKNEKFDYIEAEQNFKRLFYRGQYNHGHYLEGETNKNIINTSYQNHRGVLIGTVLEVKPFKDISEVLVVTNGYELKQNDGVKFVFNNEEVSIGIGGVKKANKKDHYYIYTKAKPKAQSEVYLTVENAWEEELSNKTKKLYFNAYFEGKIGKKPLLKLKCGEVEISQVLFENLEKAKSQGLTYEEVKKNLEKTNDTCFELKYLKANIENVFMAKSQLNELRRLALENLEKAVLTNNEKDIIEIKKQEDFYNNFKYENIENVDKIFVVINEKNNIEKELKLLKDKEVNIVFSPLNFTQKNVEEIYKKIKQYGFKKLYLDLPKFAKKENFEAIKNIIESFDKSELGLIANNVSHLIFSLKGYDVVGGAYLNIANSFTAFTLNLFNIKVFVKSFENFAEEFNKGLTYCGKPALMTYAHCPYKTTYGNDKCSECKFNNNLTYVSQNGREYKIRRILVKNCTFELVNDTEINANKKFNKNTYNDLRD